MEAKRNAREVAVQAIFQFFFSNGDIKKILNEFCNFRIREEKNYTKKYDTKFFNKIVIGVYENKVNIKKLIEENLSKEWLIDRVDPTMRAIISLAIYEFTFCKKVPLKVIIDEYVTISRLYFDKTNIGFVNGILDNLGKKIRKTNNG